MNLIMKKLLIKVFQSAQHFVDTPSHKFDELLSIFCDILTTLVSKAPNIDAYDNITKIVNVSFQKVFSKVRDIREEYNLASRSRPMVARGMKELAPVVDNQDNDNRVKYFIIEMKPLMKTRLMRLMKKMITCLMVSK